MTSCNPAERAPVVCIVCDGGGALGFGNLRRSVTLAWEFKRQGYRVRVETLSEPAANLLPQSPKDSGVADLLLLDVPYQADKWVMAARESLTPVAALDYQGSVAPDLVINIFRRGTAPVDANELVGLDYAIIRSDVLSLSPADPGRGVLVVMGGGDQSGLGERAANIVLGCGCMVELVDGPLATGDSSILLGGIARVSSPHDLASRMASCSWAVTSGGGTMLEMLCLGKPVHVIPRTTHEEMLASFILESGGLLGIGFESLQLPSPEMRLLVSTKARSLVDGKGAERIVDAVRHLLW
jgi:spore coat polysaccharide biosynthesis predicted glycosyltransferase SpsG